MSERGSGCEGRGKTRARESQQEAGGTGSARQRRRVDSPLSAHVVERKEDAAKDGAHTTSCFLFEIGQIFFASAGSSCDFFQIFALSHSGLKKPLVGPALRVRLDLPRTGTARAVSLIAFRTVFWREACE